MPQGTREKESVVMTGLFVTVFAAGAALQDLKKDKIYNVYVLAGILTGLLLCAATGGLRSLPVRMAWTVCALCIMMPVYLVGGLGAGDVKFLAGVAAFLPYREWFFVTCAAFVITALYGIGRLLVKRSLHGTVHFALPVFAGVLLLQGVRYL